MKLNKKSVVQLLKNEGLYHQPDNPKAFIKTFLNLTSLIRWMGEKGVKINEIKLRGWGQLGMTKEGVKPLVAREYTESEKALLADFFESVGIAFIRIAAEIRKF